MILKQISYSESPIWNKLLMNSTVTNNGITYSLF